MITRILLIVAALASLSACTEIDTRSSSALRDLIEAQRRGDRRAISPSPTSAPAWREQQPAPQRENALTHSSPQRPPVKKPTKLKPTSQVTAPVTSVAPPPAKDPWAVAPAPQ